MGKHTLSCGCKADSVSSGILASWDGGEDFDGSIIREYGYVCQEHMEKFKGIAVLGIEESELRGMDEQDELAMMDKQELNRIVSGALLDFLGFLAVGGEDEEFSSKMFQRDFPTIEDLQCFAQERGIILTTERAQNWNRIFL